jgi:3-isopropylmalate dehydrogenase
MPGDGIGPEIVAEAVKVMDVVGKKYGLEFAFTEAAIGGAAIDATGGPLPAATVAACKAADAVLLGAVGGPKWDVLDPSIRPEKGLLGIRKALGLFANLRPAKLFPELAAACCLRPDIVGQGLDVMVVREMTAAPISVSRAVSRSAVARRSASTPWSYAEHEVRRIAQVGFETARKRRGKLCSVDKANVLDVSRLWRAVVLEVAKDYPDVGAVPPVRGQRGHAARARPRPSSTSS